MTTFTDYHHRDELDLPFCLEGCVACALEKAERDADWEARHQPGQPCEFHPAVAQVASVFGHSYCPQCEAEISRREQEAEMAAERAWSNRYEYDEEAQRDLAYHNELWPTYYGCPTDPGASL